jgi:hypothetical protein
MELREIHVFEQEIRRHAGRDVNPAVRRVAAVAVLGNPRAGKPASDDLQEFIDLSVAAGEILSARALAPFGSVRPRAYGKAVIVGESGDLEQGAAMIHCRIGLAMRSALKAGPALIPGNAKLGGPGSSIDIVLGDAEDGWEYDSMDSMEIRVPGAPRADEIVLAVAFATRRPSARIRGATPEAVQSLMKQIRGK